jgi:hypothetical protein
MSCERFWLAGDSKDGAEHIFLSLTIEDLAAFTEHLKSRDVE